MSRLNDLMNAGLKKDQKPSGAQVLGRLAGAIAVAPVSITASGYTISQLWQWFAVPAFGLPALSIPLAAGLGMLATFTSPVVPNADRTIANITISHLIRCAFVLLFGWILTMFL